MISASVRAALERDDAPPVDREVQGAADADVGERRPPDVEEQVVQRGLGWRRNRPGARTATASRRSGGYSGLKRFAGDRHVRAAALDGGELCPDVARAAHLDRDAVGEAGRPRAGDHVRNAGLRTSSPPRRRSHAAMRYGPVPGGGRSPVCRRGVSAGTT